MILHLVPRESKLFIPVFVEAVLASKHACNNIFMCYAGDLALPTGNIPSVTPESVRAGFKERHITRVIVHGLQPAVYPVLKEIRRMSPHCRIEWIYWGECFEAPADIYGKCSLKEEFRARKIPTPVWPIMYGSGLATAISRVRNWRFRIKAAKCARLVNVIHHWSKIDYERIKALLKCRHLEYSEFEYDGGQLETPTGSRVADDVQCDPADCLVVGHSASLRNNHMDVLPYACSFAVKFGKTVVCPLSYTCESGRYIDVITLYLKSVPSLSYRILTKFYSRDDYLSFLYQCGAYVAPGRGSIGAGNMLNYIRFGGIPVASSRNSTAQFCSEQGIEVSMYTDSAELDDLLPKVFGRRSSENIRLAQARNTVKNRGQIMDKLLSERSINV